MSTAIKVQRIEATKIHNIETRAVPDNLKPLLTRMYINNLSLHLYALEIINKNQVMFIKHFTHFLSFSLIF